METNVLILILFLYIVTATILGITIYLMIKFKESEGDKVKVIKTYHVLTEDDLGKHLIVVPEDITIVVPEDSFNWNGVISIENFSDTVNVFTVNTKSNIIIVEYNDSTIDYGTELPINGKVYNYNNKSGSVHLNNYIIDIKFSNEIPSINVRTIIADSVTFT